MTDKIGSGEVTVKEDINSLSEPIKDYYKCILNPAFTKKYPDDIVRMTYVEKVVNEDMGYYGMTMEEVKKKYGLEIDSKNNNANKDK